MLFPEHCDTHHAPRHALDQGIAYYKCGCKFSNHTGASEGWTHVECDLKAWPVPTAPVLYSPDPFPKHCPVHVQPIKRILEGMAHYTCHCIYTIKGEPGDYIGWTHTVTHTVDIQPDPLARSCETHGHVYEFSVCQMCGGQEPRPPAAAPIDPTMSMLVIGGPIRVEAFVRNDECWLVVECEDRKWRFNGVPDFAITEDLCGRQEPQPPAAAPSYEHGMDDITPIFVQEGGTVVMIVKLHDGRVFKWPGSLQTPHAEDLRR